MNLIDTYVPLWWVVAAGIGGILIGVAIVLSMLADDGRDE